MLQGVLRCYQQISKSINADQPRADVLSQAYSYLSTMQRNNAAPHTPRIILLGPPGSGKSVQSALLTSKYQLVNINCDEVGQIALFSWFHVGAWHEFTQYAILCFKSSEKMKLYQQIEVQKKRCTCVKTKDIFDWGGSMLHIFGSRCSKFASRLDCQRHWGLQTGLAYGWHT